MVVCKRKTQKYFLLLLSRLLWFEKFRIIDVYGYGMSKQKQNNVNKSFKLMNFNNFFVIVELLGSVLVNC